MPNREDEVSLWTAVSFWKLLSWAAPMKERHWTILAHTALSLGHLEIIFLFSFRHNPYFIICFPLSKFWKCVVLCGERSGGHHGIHRAHWTTRPNSHVKQQQEGKQCSEQGRQRVLAVWGASPQWKCLFTGCPYYLHFLPLQNVWCYLWNHTGTEYR